jgi:hypothetical protein
LCSSVPYMCTSIACYFRHWNTLSQFFGPGSRREHCLPGAAPGPTCATATQSGASLGARDVKSHQTACPASTPGPSCVGGFLQLELGGLGSDVAHLGDDGAHLAVVGDPLFIEVGLALGEPTADGLAVDLGAPLPIGAVELWRVGAAAAAGAAAAGEALGDAARGDQANLGELGGLPPSPPTGGGALLVDRSPPCTAFTAEGRRWTGRCRPRDRFRAGSGGGRRTRASGSRCAWPRHRSGG